MKESNKYLNALTPVQEDPLGLVEARDMGWAEA
jgi:hypothetical protein